MAVQQGFNLERLILHCPDEESAINFLRDRGILHQQREHCGQEMRLSYRTVRGKRLEVWRCVVKACKSTRGVRPCNNLRFSVPQTIVSDRHMDSSFTVALQNDPALY